jgi:predicted flap endonuclease-1-like 5' DNA nuclease
LALMGYRIDRIEGIGAAYAGRLRKIGITRTDQLLERGRTRADRKELSDELTLDERVILKWVNMCDLMRIKGVGEEYSELLEVAGVDTVRELRSRNARNLTLAMRDANAAKKLVRQLPGEAQVARWIEAAGTLVPMIEH